jgi:hypothetical protein
MRRSVAISEISSNHFLLNTLLAWCEEKKVSEKKKNRTSSVERVKNQDIRPKAGLHVTMGSQADHSGDIVSSGNDIKETHRSEVHRALLESRSLDTGWNFALEELGRMNIKFDPAWMSGKNIRCTVSSFSIRSRITGWAWLFACACQNTIRSTLIRCHSKGKNLPKTQCDFWKTFERRCILETLIFVHSVCRV